MMNSAEKERKEIEELIETIQANIQENSQLIFDLERRVSVLRAKNQVNLGKIYKLFERYRSLL